MTDRENVIRAMECCAVGAECDHCSYSPMNKFGYEGCYQMHADALALLKAQETVKPKEVKMYPSDQYACGSCGHVSVGSKDYHAKYCPECGRKVKWE